MLRIANVIGDVSDPRFEGKKRDLLVVDRTRASKRRLRGLTASGADVALELPRGTYLYEGRGPT